MKNKKLIAIIAVFILLLAVPIPTGAYHNGETKVYTALTYKIIERESYSKDGGVYSETKVYPFPLNFMSADFLIASTARAAFESKNTSPERCSSGEKENEETLAEPPVLKVVYDGGNCITADPASYCWTYIDSKGEVNGICADALHPLQSRNFMKEILPSSSQVELSFEKEPDSLTVCCWSDSCWGKTDSHSEDVKVINGAISLKKGGYIYQVTGIWNDELLKDADASYSFYAVLN